MEFVYLHRLTVGETFLAQYLSGRGGWGAGAGWGMVGVGREGSREGWKGVAGKGVG